MPENVFHLSNQLAALGLDLAVVILQSLGQQRNGVRQDGQVVLALLVQKRFDDLEHKETDLKRDVIFKPDYVTFVINDVMTQCFEWREENHLQT